MGAVISVLGVGLLVGSSVAVPPPQDPLPPNANSHSYNFGAQDDGAPATGGRAPAESPRGGPVSGGRAREPQDAPRDCQELSEYVQVVCSPVHGGGNKAPKVSPRELALTRWARMPIPAPVVRTAPPRVRTGLVGLPEWFWVANWHSLGGRVSARDVWVEVTARPQGMTVSPGPREPLLRCSGPGTAYDRTRPAASQRTDCSYTFERSSLYEPGHAYRVQVTVVWGGTWRGSDGSGGALPPVSRSTSFRLRVAEAQALYG